jgi:hypothetical protein
MKEYTIDEFRLELAKTIREAIEKYEDLFKTSDFSRHKFDQR